MRGASLKPGSCLIVVKTGRFCAKPDRDSPNSKNVNAAFKTMVLLVAILLVAILLVAMLLKSCRMLFPPAAIMLASRKAHNAPQVNWLSTGNQGKIKSFVINILLSKSS
jgi:hypothetical protein